MAVVKHLRQLSIRIYGRVQGVGFRPFVAYLAQQYQQCGWAANTDYGLQLVIEGQINQQQALLTALSDQAPTHAYISQLSYCEQPLQGLKGFQIKASLTTVPSNVWVTPDLGPCSDCVNDIQNPASRFFNYPFTSCTNCGPRYSIMRSQPYDRARTSMATFALCAACQNDYQQPNNRRFHSQTIACPECGPQLSLLNSNGQPLASNNPALTLALAHLQSGEILALKGVGGFQLLVDATNQAAVQRLRDRKQRPHKPFALLSADLASAAQLCHLDQAAIAALTSSAAPIVLVTRHHQTEIAPTVAADLGLLGVMLPASTLHFLLAKAFAKPLVITSGNAHQQPICYDNAAAIEQLASIADVFLIHDRPIVRPLDDSVLRIINNQATVLRRGRGFVPSAIDTGLDSPTQLALGGEFKNTVAINRGAYIISSQHLGNMNNLGNQQLLQTTVADLQSFYHLQPQSLLHDLHPDYYTSQYASQQAIASAAIQHHHAHINAGMAEHQLTAPVLGFAWDGIGLGLEHSLLGSECLLLTASGYQRIAALRQIALIGGDQANRQPRRVALSLLHQLFGEQIPTLNCLNSFDKPQLNLLQQMLHKGINCPNSSSAGRLFDGVASLLDICHINHFEGEAAMRLEQAASLSDNQHHYPFELSDELPITIDWRPMLRAIITDIAQLPTQHIAAKFHNTLAQMLLTVANHVGEKRIVLSGGCFQNRLFTEQSYQLLTDHGYQVFCQHQIPANDGGLAVGQLYAAMRGNIKKP